MLLEWSNKTVEFLQAWASWNDTKKKAKTPTRSLGHDHSNRLKLSLAELHSCIAPLRLA